VSSPARASFATRDQCIACAGVALETLARGDYSAEPVHGFITGDPWGQSPMPFISEDHWDFVRCRDCAQKFHRRVLAPEWQQRLFTDWMSADAIREFEATHGVDTPEHQFDVGRANVRHVLRLEKMTRSLRGRSPLRVLDFGCGWGHFLAAAAVFGAEAYGIDKDSDRRRGAEGFGFEVLPDLGELDPKLKGAFHALTLFQVLEHLVDPREVLAELAQWLMPGGILVLETPDCEGIEDIRTPDDYRGINPLSHINGFTPTTLAGIAERTGFEPTEPTVAHATVEPVQVGKTEVRRLVGRFLPRTTAQYFRRRG